MVGGQDHGFGFLIVGGQDHGFGFLIVGGAAWVVASVLVAGAALVAPFAVLGMTVADKMFAAAVSAAWDGDKHRLILPSQTNLSHYLFFEATNSI